MHKELILDTKTEWKMRKGQMIREITCKTENPQNTNPQ